MLTAAERIPLNGSSRKDMNSRSVSATVRKCKESLHLLPEAESEPPSKFQCSICAKEFTTSSSLLRHVWKKKSCATSSSCFQCDVCQRSLPSAKCLRSHMRCFHLNVSCVLCEKTVQGEQYLKRHIEAMHKGKTYACRICKREFTSSTYVVAHMRKHTGEAPFKCQHCEKSFKRSDCLKLHVLTMHRISLYRSGAKTGAGAGVARYECVICSRSFTNKLRLDLHTKHLHFEASQCSLCFEQFSHPIALRRHQLRAHPETSPAAFACAQCSFSSPRKFEIANHMLNHSGFDISHPELFAFQCHFCGKAFACGYNLPKHLRAHAIAKGGKRFPCPICSAPFGSASQLSRHLPVHLYNDEAGKLYKCAHCLLSFGFAEGLIAHLSLHHTQRKPFPCNRCGRGFVWTRDLVKHAKTTNQHAKEGTLTNHCPLCLEGFRACKDLVGHFLRHPEVAKRRR